MKGIKIKAETFFGTPKIVTIWKRPDSNNIRLSIQSSSHSKGTQIVLDISELKEAIQQIENQGT